MHAQSVYSTTSLEVIDNGRKKSKRFWLMELTGVNSTALKLDSLETPGRAARGRYEACKAQLDLRLKRELCETWFRFPHAHSKMEYVFLDTR
ncbi:hypothetical protein TNCV_151501 [Trichonephila clavipes]|uniref:Uncharacterized protein n=1 Tax=Trichonephila clavipes TaxID=2585209 RepID=A0A8X6V4Z2_TRICX|nr:hypothetical protein TNCV_151501 [Trichonephila clavipes]